MLQPARRSGGAAQAIEELVDRRPGIGTAGKPAPSGADQADKGKASVDRNPIVLPRAVEAIDQQGLDIRLQVGELRVAGDDPFPGIEARAAIRLRPRVRDRARSASPPVCCGT